ncbi:tRNA (N(6)-L-threonylcarbamoyladenosine(37)-C(2))-methylthiotransferase MtaB [Enterocloster bolteae]|uniref:tRNA (N(6)-L-threonylcarbamoyladenosine(37)-C(2))- methylthiotransferase MtaB n=1 Tax=Enterocloster bolteae TaxID=208479 RepID=UPI0028DCC90A|nr:tRNA (N(6)-L-threonylcarbamoyladenosine(37)-C(2))-methylthiotransferase MtaB [Enterocloster bolteae]
MPKAALHNLGCKVNAYETEAMQQQLEERGYEIVPFDQKADVYIINTCSVTNIADRKSRQMLHRAKKLNPEAVVVAAGCYVQVASDALKEDDSVDIIVGNNNKARLADILEEYMKDRQGDEGGYVLDIARAREYEELHVSRLGEHTRAFIKVQDGCNQFCSYCIIPYARGRVRSRKPEDVEAEVKGLVARGYREVVLTGIHLSSYGTEHMEGSPVKGGDWDSGPLWDLIERIHRVEGLERIRLGSLEPRIITREFAEKLAGLPEFCPHFHLSLQSGCDATLKRMNRHYTTEDYLRRCGILREIFDQPAITTDVIAGFPGETEEEFEETRRFLETVRFYEMHVFKYSKRQGTRAAVMEDQVSEQVKARRSDVLLELEKTMSREYRERFAGSRVSVLFEEAAEIGGKWYMMGHTPQYVRAALPLEDGMNREEFGGRIMELFASGLLNDEMLKVEFS